jgi:hypothetical protein
MELGKWDLAAVEVYKACQRADRTIGQALAMGDKWKAKETL